MIISASRRTDIPAYYSEWFFNRIKEGYVLVRNPINTRQISKIILSPTIVDCIVFWTKNPQPMLSNIDHLDGYPFYFQFTLTAYAQDIELRLPRKTEITDTFIRLSEKIGPERIIWRYDPILLDDKHTIAWHTGNFEKLAKKLKGWTKKVTFSFIDLYKKYKKINMNIKNINYEEKNIIAKNLSGIALENDLIIDTCAEDIDLSVYNIGHARCIDERLISKMTGYNLEIGKDKNQRGECACVSSIDIGAYNSCMNGCLYCYANYSPASVANNIKKHNPSSPILIDGCGSNDIIQEKNIKSNKILQKELL
jgi:hypothetical protein